MQVLKNKESLNAAFIFIQCIYFQEAHGWNQRDCQETEQTLREPRRLLVVNQGDCWLLYIYYELIFFNLPCIFIICILKRMLQKVLFNSIKHSFLQFYVLNVTFFHEILAYFYGHPPRILSVLITDHSYEQGKIIFHFFSLPLTILLILFLHKDLGFKRHREMKTLKPPTSLDQYFINSL